MAPIFFELLDDPRFEVRVCLTGQHRSLVTQVVDQFDFNVDYNLDVMVPGQDAVDVMVAVQAALKNVLKLENPDLVLVHGDTTTSMAAALNCFLLSIKLGHVEAGLRTHNLQSPFPEEFNRRLTSIASSLHFAPTELSRQNLIDENVPLENIFVTGNTVIDALRMTMSEISSGEEKRKSLSHQIRQKVGEWPFDSKFILVTSHRRENFGSGLIQICSSLKRIAEAFPNIDLVFPVHPNPNVLGPVTKMLGGLGNVHLIDPLPYDLFCFMLKECYLVLTDSGGIQEEAPSLNKPVLVMRDTTERPEGVDAGVVKLVGTSESEIYSGVEKLLIDRESYDVMAVSENPYGDGFAAKKIVAAIAGAL